LSFNKILAKQINMVGVIFISVMSSIFTVFVANGLSFLPPPNPLATTDIQEPLDKVLLSKKPATMTHCGEFLFSPIQKKCVPKDVFDAEMNRLFAALGLDTKPYQRNQDNP
jgi:hypothetical protein